MSNGDLKDTLMKKLKVLHDGPWEGRASAVEINDWLDNFNGPDKDLDSLSALYLLSNFMYFGDREIRELLKALFRDKYVAPLVEEIRRSLGGTKDEIRLNAELAQKLDATRFVGMGNPAESGTHLLYYFRQENGLKKDLFISPHQMFEFPLGRAVLKDRSVEQYVFIDDFCGSGSQALDYSEAYLRMLKQAAQMARITVKVSYHVLFGTSQGIENVRTNSLFDEVECLSPLDESYRSLTLGSRYFTHPGPVTLDQARKMAENYGLRLVPLHPLGFDDGELLIGFHHNTPDNSLPIIWYDDDPSDWMPVFRRYPKV